MSKKKKNPIWLFMLIGLIIIIAVVIVFVVIKPFQKEKKIDKSNQEFASSINRINKMTDDDIKKMFQTQENYQLPEGLKNVTTLTTDILQDNTTNVKSTNTKEQEFLDYLDSLPENVKALYVERDLLLKKLKEIGAVTTPLQEKKNRSKEEEEKLKKLLDEFKEVSQREQEVTKQWLAAQEELPDTESKIDFKNVKDITELKKLVCNSLNLEGTKKLISMIVEQINKVGREKPTDPPLIPKDPPFVNYLVEDVIEKICKNQDIIFCKQQIKNIVLYIVYLEKVANVLLKDNEMFVSVLESTFTNESELYNFITLFELLVDSFDTFRKERGLSDDDLKKIGIAADKEYSRVTAKDIKIFMNKIQNNKNIPDCK